MFKQKLFNNRTRLTAFIPLLAILILVGVVIAQKLKTSDQSNISQTGTLTINQEISKAEFESPSEYSLKIEQDDDTPLKIVNASVKSIPNGLYQNLTTEKAKLAEVVSVPKVTLINVSDKTIVGVTLIINDKTANTNRGLYIREQSIKPGQQFIINPENFVKSGANPEKNPKFWLETQDKSQVAVRVVANFEDGTMWSNKNYGVK